METAKADIETTRKAGIKKSKGEGGGANKPELGKTSALAAIVKAGATGAKDCFVELKKKSKTGVRSLGYVVLCYERLASGGVGEMCVAPPPPIAHFTPPVYLLVVIYHMHGSFDRAIKTSDVKIQDGTEVLRQVIQDLVGGPGRPDADATIQELQREHSIHNAKISRILAVRLF